jgi:hypothetical protein
VGGNSESKDKKQEASCCNPEGKQLREETATKQ